MESAIVERQEQPLKRSFDSVYESCGLIQDKTSIQSCYTTPWRGQDETQQIPFLKE